MLGTKSESSTEAPIQNTHLICNDAALRHISRIDGRPAAIVDPGAQAGTSSD